MERLQKVLAQCGVASRRKAEELIVSGAVKVDGEVIRTLGYKVDYSSKIEVNGVLISREEKYVYILNKPRSVITSLKDDKGRLCVGDIVKTGYRLFPVGRLDYDSSGLLIMTNDGELANRLTHPKYNIPKTYEVTASGNITIKDISKLKKGVVLDDGYKTSKADIYYLSSNEDSTKHRYLVTIYEGHNRQIRKMFETIGAKVTRLHRIKEANIELGNLKSGEYRRLKVHEVKMLKKYLDEFDI